MSLQKHPSPSDSSLQDDWLDADETAFDDVEDIEEIEDIEDIEDVDDFEDLDADEILGAETSVEDGTETDDEALAEAEVPDELDEDLDEELAETADRSSWFSRSVFHGTGSVFISMVVHALLLVILALAVVPGPVKHNISEIVAELYEEREEEEFVEVELDQQIEAAEEMAISVMSTVPDAGALGESAAAETAMQLNQEVVDQSQATEVVVSGIEMIGPPTERMVTEVPDGAMGDPRAIVDNYQQAMDRITQEILLSLEKGPLLVTWCFDQSESMKDDQQDIRDRIGRVYKELGLVDASSGDALTTAITSYGEKYFDHSNGKPTNSLPTITKWMDEVPIDEAGKEMMCQAVGSTVTRYQQYCRRTRRQMMLILVTDESGERENNDQFLERAIDVARAARCRIYTLGREAVFGYPYAHIRWKHPETKRIHWLRIDRGPETAFVEQLQTNGFYRRFDAFPSGFGPYEQCRMSRETGGIFFMLPSLETNLVRGQKRRYQLDLMKPYRVDLRKRPEVLQDIESRKLRAVLTKVIYDLNPYNEQAKKIIVMRHEFSNQLPEFRQQADVELRKVKVYLPYLAAASETVEGLAHEREQEADPRWQANYDLIRAQLMAYQARVNEYAACLVDFVKNPPVVPMTKSPNLSLVHWDMGYQKELRTEEVVRPYIDKANKLFEQVIANHPGTPWAARAEDELKRGYGIVMRPDYDPPYDKPSGRIKIPKL